MSLRTTTTSTASGAAFLGVRERRQTLLANAIPYGHNSYMRTIPAREAKNQFGQFLDAAQRGPVQVTKKGRPVGVMLSLEQYERLRGSAWGRLGATMDAASHEAERNGLTDEALDALLADES